MKNKSLERGLRDGFDLVEEGITHPRKEARKDSGLAGTEELIRVNVGKERLAAGDESGKQGFGLLFSFDGPADGEKAVDVGRPVVVRRIDIETKAFDGTAPLEG